MIDLILNYLNNSSAVTITVLVLLSFYLILTFWIFIYRFMALSSLVDSEKRALEALVSRETITISPLSSLSKCTSKTTNHSSEILSACEISLIREASSGVSWLSIISSTSPFVGLFGTVVGILESFAKFSSHSKVGFSIIAPAISEALVATAAGIFVAIFAYTFHQLIVRKIYEFDTFLKAQSKILVSRG
ncbi:MAG: MotA/TolQ/ExbB proton channel family protein [Candidatus Marinarcus sp.]|uniref:MotA/TolQ/ExbB proton channel family protein n=1 Tax=Candidatus Marinarcus sp. TaxID=3100987 RepID=UPI003B00DCEC